MPQTRILFVDDEPGIRLTLPSVLEHHGFEVQVAGTVAEALNLISSSNFDVLISDLNIGHAGDGFTVVSAMRRVQPNCVNLILTGYPAFETALRAIQSHVDDYLIKPTDIENLVTTIERRIVERTAAPGMHLGGKRVGTILRENVRGIQDRVLARMRDDAELAQLHLSDEERVSYVPALLEELANLLDSPDPLDVPDHVLSIAASHGRDRHSQGYTIPMLIEDARIVERAIFDVVQEHILELDLSRLLTDLKLAIDISQVQTRESAKAFQAVAA